MDINAMRAQQQADNLAAVMLAKLKVLELATAAIIASHPNPEAALAIWDRVHLDWADEAFEATVTPYYRDQMAKSLGSWTQAFRNAAQKE